MKYLFIIIFLFISMCLWAQNVPQTIDYQGRLADSDGNYLNGVVTVEFLIYDLESGGTSIWNEIQDVSTANGIFHVLLGSVTPFPSNIFDDSDRWLELVVGGETLSPRTQIASVPYSIKAESAYTVEVPLNLSGNVSDPNSVIKGENTGTGYGVWGSDSNGNYGYLGGDDGAGGSHFSGNCGALGSSTSGVHGYNYAGMGYGVHGTNMASNGYGVYGINEGNDGYGVYGYDITLNGYGVYGHHISYGNYGYLGSSNCGVYGFNSALNGYGVYGNSTGYYGGYFESNYNNSNTHVIHAEFTGTAPSYATAVYGKSRPVDGFGIGGYFEGGYRGVYGIVYPTGNDNYVGVHGYVDGGSGTNYAIYGTANGSGNNYAGYFSGNVHVTGTFTNPSDERFKENVQPFKNALSKIKLMNVHTFNFKQMEEKQLVLPEGEQIGLIAQELEKILPELVKDEVHAYDKNEGIEGAESDMEKIEFKGINYIGLIPVLIEAIKELQMQNEDHQKQLEEQQRQIDALLSSAGKR